MPRCHKIAHITWVVKKARELGVAGVADIPITVVAGQHNKHVDQIVLITSGTDPRTQVTDFPEAVTFEDRCQRMSS